MLGTPTTLSEEERLNAFKAGWNHLYGGQPQVGYYIGRPHPPYTQCRVVRSVEPADASKYLVDCADGEPGQLITRGAHPPICTPTPAATPASPQRRARLEHPIVQRLALLHRHARAASIASAKLPTYPCLDSPTATSIPKRAIDRLPPPTSLTPRRR